MQTFDQHLHERLLQSVMSAPCGWFDATPVGRIVNRFSQDVSTVDSSIINNMYGFVDRLLATTQIVGVICISLPLLMLPLLPIVLFTWWVSRQYLHVSRELKRLESLKKSPVFVLFSETLQVLHCTGGCIFCNVCLCGGQLTLLAGNHTIILYILRTTGFAGGSCFPRRGPFLQDVLRPHQRYEPLSHLPVDRQPMARVPHAVARCYGGWRCRPCRYIPLHPNTS